MLDNTPFYKLLKSRIFVLDKSTIDVEKLNAYGEVSIRETQRDINEANMITGEKYWRLKIEERGLLFKKRRREKKNEF